LSNENGREGEYCHGRDDRRDNLIAHLSVANLQDPTCRVKSERRLPTALCAVLLFAIAAPLDAAGTTWSDVDLANASAVVLSGQVVDVATGWDADTIYTYVTLTVDGVVKGWLPERRVTLKQLGGRVGDLALIIDDQASFTRGENIVVFLSVRPRDRTLTTTALGQGKWTIVRDPQSGERLATRRPRVDGSQAALGVAEARSLSALVAAGRSGRSAPPVRDVVVDPREARAATPVRDVDATRFFRPHPRIVAVQPAPTSCFTQLRSPGRWSVASDGCGEIDVRREGPVISGTWVRIGRTIEALKAGTIGSSSGPTLTAVTPAVALPIGPLPRPGAARFAEAASANATAQTTRVSVTSDGNQLGGDSRSPAVSPDGRYVAFTFNGSILGLHDNQTGATSAIGATTGTSRFTADGRYVVYLSSASGTAAAYDVTTGTTRTLDVPSAVVSDDLRYGAFSTYGGVTVGSISYVRDLQTGQDTAIPAPPLAGFPDYRDVANPVLSSSGRYVAFSHVNLPPMFLGKRTYTYVWDRISGSLVQVAEGFPLSFTRDERSLLVSCFCAVSGLIADLSTGNVSTVPLTMAASLAISPNGRFVAFVDSSASVQHVYVLDRTTGQTQQADISADGASANANASAGAPDDNGRVVYASNATNLVPGDTNGTSDIFLTVVGGATTPPGRPFPLRSTVSPAAAPASLVVLDWTAPTVGGAPTTYVIEAGSAPGLIDAANFSTNSAATTFSALVNGPAVFFVRVRAANSAGVSEPSNEVVVRVGTVASAVPGPPVNLTATVSGSTVSLAWQAPTYGGAPEGYVIQAGSRDFGSDLANFSVGSSVTGYTATGVAPGTYFVRVLAFNNAGVSAGGSSNAIVVTVAGTQPCSAPPGAPFFDFPLVTGSTVNLAWQPNGGLPTSYIVEAGSAPTLADLANFDTGSSVAALTVTGVGPGTYYVRVRARNACGISTSSGEWPAFVR
jgi:Tol biopolymer transport system component